MIVTVTLNPVIERTIVVDEFKLGATHPTESQTISARGKGMHVSRIVHALKEETLATGLLAGKNGRFIADQLAQEEINNHFLFIPGLSQENTKIKDLKTSMITEFKGIGPSLEEEDVERFLHHLEEILSQGDILVLSGTLPKEAPHDFYAKMIRRVRPLGVFTILDTANSALKAGLDGKPNIIKPNIAELEELLEMTFETEEDIIQGGKVLIQKGIDEVLITLGKEGAIYLSDNDILKITTTDVEVLSTKGAGDAFVGGLAVGLLQGKDTMERLRFASACATASVRLKGLDTPSLEMIEQVIEDIEVVELT
jgi:1-phosphofructokinase